MRFCGARGNPLRGSAWSRYKKTQGVFRFLICPRDPLRRFAWSRFKNRGLFAYFLRCADEPSAEIVRVDALSAVRIHFSLGKPSAEIVRVEALSPCDFITREMALGSCLAACAPAFAIPRSRVQFRPGPRAAPARKCSRRSSSGWKIVTVKYERSNLSQLRRKFCARSSLSQLRLENRNL